MSELLQREFRNEHLSVSRLKLYEACPLAFYKRYVNKSGPKGPLPQAPLFGIVLHAALEAVFHWILENEHSGPFPTAELVGFYQQAWRESDLASVDLYQEGLAILRSYAGTYDMVDHFSILAVEQEFNIVVDGFKLNGYIDRVDKVSDEEVMIVDYKSNWMLFHSDELEHDLQMSIYGLAARTLYPWAKRVSFRFDMLRHNLPQYAHRTAAVIDDAAGYVVAIGKRTEEDKNWYPRLDPNCKYCDHRLTCDAYKTVIDGKHPTIRPSDMDDMEAVLKERNEVRTLANLLYARQKELDKVVATRLKKEGEFQLAGFQCRYINPQSTSYDLAPVVRAFTEVGLTEDEVRSKVCVVDDKMVEELRVETITKIDRPKALMLKVSLEAVAKKTPTTPRLDVRELKTAKTVENAKKKR